MVRLAGGVEKLGNKRTPIYRFSKKAEALGALGDVYPKPGFPDSLNDDKQLRRGDKEGTVGAIFGYFSGVPGIFALDGARFNNGGFP